MNDPGIELGLMVVLLQEGTARPVDVLGSPGEMFRDRLIDVNFRTSTVRNAQFQCGSNSVAGSKPRYLRNLERTARGPYNRS